jgi:uncharacterized membrane protein YbhN (UPF0104 family)
VLLLISSQVAVRAVRALQLGAALQPLGPTPGVLTVAKAQLVATWYSLFLPGSLAAGGVTWYYLAAVSGKTASACALLYVRVLNTLVLVPFAMLGILAEPRLRQSRASLTLLVAGLACLALSLPFLSRSAANWLRRPLAVAAERRRPGRLKRLLERLSEVLTAYREARARERFNVVLPALLDYGLGSSVVLLSAVALGVSIPWSVFLWLYALLQVIHALPITFGGTGLRELGLVWALGLYGVDPSLAVSMGILLFVVMLLTGALPGAILSWRTGATPSGTPPEAE